MPSTNTSASTATEITSLPITINQDVSDVASPFKVWFKYTAQAGDQALSVTPWASLTSNYRPYIECFVGDDPLSLDEWTNYDQMEGPRRPIVVPLIVGETYYFSVMQTQSGLPVPNESLQIRFVGSPNVPVPAGSLIVTDDSPTWGAVALDANDGSVLRYIKDAPASEYGMAMPSGRYVHANLSDPVTLDFIQSVDFFDSDFNKYASFVFPNDDIYPVGVSFDASERVYVIADDFSSTSANGRLYILDADDASVIAGPIDIGVTLQSNAGAGVNPAGTILYFMRTFVANEPIRRWNLTTQTAMSDFVSAPTGYAPGRGDIIVLDDDSVLVPWEKFTAPRDRIVIRYSAAGSVLHTYQISDDPLDLDAGAFNRMALDLSAGGSRFWHWSQPLRNNGSGKFSRVSQYKLFDIGTGSVIRQFEVAGVFSLGEATWDDGYFTSLDDIPPFGPSPSCPIMVATEGIPVEFSSPPPPPEPPVGEPPPGTTTDDTCPCEPGTGPVLPPDPTIPIPDWVASCGFGGLAPDGTVPVYSENWLLQ